MKYFFFSLITASVLDLKKSLTIVLSAICVYLCIDFSVNYCKEL